MASQECLESRGSTRGHVLRLGRKQIGHTLWSTPCERLHAAMAVVRQEVDADIPTRCFRISPAIESSESRGATLVHHQPEKTIQIIL